MGFKINDRIYHNRYGFGIIEEFVTNKIVIIKFDNNQLKSIQLRLLKKSNKPTIKEDLISNIKQSYKEGLIPCKIIKKHNITALKLKQIVKEYNIDTEDQSILKDRIISLINQGEYILTRISNKLKISSNSLNKFFKKHNDVYFLLKNKRKVRNPKREEQILKLLNENISFDEIAKKFGITKQRVNQIAKRNNIKRWEQSREFKISMYLKIMDDFNNNISLNDICLKHNLSIDNINTIFCFNNDNTIFSKFREKRNSCIISDFIGGTTAKAITKRDDKELLDPNKITWIDSIYRINIKNGIRRYPQIGNRAGGGCFENKEILKFIFNKRDKYKWTFKKITDELNKKGKKTLTGKVFTIPNVFAKYYSNKG